MSQTDKQSAPSASSHLLSGPGSLKAFFVRKKNCTGLDSGILTPFSWQVLKRNQEPERIKGLPIFFSIRSLSASRIYLEVLFSISFFLHKHINNCPIIHTPELYLQNVSINYPANRINTVERFKDVQGTTTNQPVPKYLRPVWNQLKPKAKSLAPRGSWREAGGFCRCCPGRPRTVNHQQLGVPRPHILEVQWNNDVWHNQGWNKEFKRPSSMLRCWEEVKAVVTWKWNLQFL